MDTGGKPFVRWDDLDTVLFGNSAKSRKSGSKQSVPHLGEISLSNKSYSELSITEYRRLVCESYKYFAHFHSQINQGEDMKPDRIVTPTEAKKMCLLFAELLQSILFEKIENMADERDQQFCTELKVFEMFLSLSSFVIFGGCNKVNSSGLSYELAEWIKVRQPCGEQMRDSCLKVTPPNRSESFWPAVYSLFIVGDLYGAVHLLRLHECSHLPDFNAVIELIEAFARLHADLSGLAEESDNDNATTVLSPGYGTGKSSVYFALRNQWHSLTEAARVTGERMSSSGEKTSDWHNRLLVVVDLLTGKETALSDLKPYCDAWYQMLVPRLLYIDPFVACGTGAESSGMTPRTPTRVTGGTHAASDLTKHAKWCLSFYFGSTPALSPSDSLFYSLLTRDLVQLAKGIGENFSNWWLLAHLLDLFCLCGSFLELGGWLVPSTVTMSASKQSVQQQLTPNMLLEMRNFAMLEYALSLANDNDLWPIAAGYLIDTVPAFIEEEDGGRRSNNPNGAELASFLIRRAVTRFPHGETLDRALDVCKRLDLLGCYAELCVGEANQLFAAAKALKADNYEMQGCKKEWLLVAALSWAARPSEVDSARQAANSIVCELLTSTSCKVLTDPKSGSLWESLYVTAVGILAILDSSTSTAAPSTLPFLNLAVRLYELHKAAPEEAVDLLSKMMTVVISAGMLSESTEKAQNLNGLLALELRSVLQNFVSSPRSTRLSDSFLLTLSKCVRDVSCLPQQQVADSDLNKLLMIAIRQNTSSW